MSWTVRNTGGGNATGSWTDYVYLSDNAAYEGADRYLTSEWTSRTEPLAPNDSYSASRKLALYDVAPGHYYLLFVADGSHTQPEANENNNLAALPLDVSAPNLVVLNPSTPPQTQAGGDITVTWTAKNSGNTSALAPWTERAVLSTDEWFGNWDDVVLGTVNQTTELAVDGTVTRAVTGQVPWGWQGNYTLFIGVDAGRNVVESNEKDNTFSATIKVEYGRPPADLLIGVVNVPASAGTGRPVDLSWRVTNQGTAATDQDSWTDVVYLSSDANAGNDIWLGNFPHTGRLNAGESYSQVKTLTLPVDLTAGQYWIFVVTDANNQVSEPGAENNNTTASQSPMNVTLSPVPDLAAQDISGPASASTGQPIIVNWVVRNNGLASASGPWKEQAYLSVDGTLTGAVLLGTFEYVNSLAFGQSVVRTKTVTLPVWADGNDRLVVVVDSDQRVFERDGETNNTTAAKQAIALVHPDLVVDSAQGPVAVQSGTRQDVTWTVRNAGTGVAPEAWADRLYLSADATISADDVLLATVNHSGALMPGATHNGKTTSRCPTASRHVYLIVRTDSGNVLEEGQFNANNDKASAAVAVTLAPYANLTVTEVTALDRSLATRLT